jgi:hypothetical protein
MPGSGNGFSPARIGEALERSTLLAPQSETAAGGLLSPRRLGYVRRTPATETSSVAPALPARPGEVAQVVAEVRGLTMMITQTWIRG